MDYEEASLVATFPKFYTFKFASLFKVDEIDLFKFWETVAVNRGGKYVCSREKMKLFNGLLKGKVTEI